MSNSFMLRFFIILNLGMLKMLREFLPEVKSIYLQSEKDESEQFKALSCYFISYASPMCTNKLSAEFLSNLRKEL
jgi:hypothetical protein